MITILAVNRNNDTVSIVISLFRKETLVPEVVNLSVSSDDAGELATDCSTFPSEATFELAPFS